MARRGMHPLLELTRARLLEMIREPGAVFWTFGFPVLLAIGLGIAFASRPPEPVRVAVVGPEAARVVDLLVAETEVELPDLAPEEVNPALRTGRVDLVVAAGEEEGALTVTYRLDPARPQARLARHVVDEAIQEARGRRDPVPSQQQVVTEQGGRYIDFLMPGLIGLNVMSSSMWGTGYTIVLARRRKLLKRLAATPMLRAHFLLSFALARLVFLVLEVAALVLAGWLIFRVAVHGSILVLSLVSLLGALSFMGVALLVASRPRDTEVASGWMNVVMLPMWILSGAFFSYERFPEPFLPFIRALPLTALNDALRAVMNDGAGLWATLPELGILAAWGLAGFVLAFRLFRWQ